MVIHPNSQTCPKHFPHLQLSKIFYLFSLWFPFVITTPTFSQLPFRLKDAHQFLEMAERGIMKTMSSLINYHWTLDSDFPDSRHHLSFLSLQLGLTTKWQGKFKISNFDRFCYWNFAIAYPSFQFWNKLLSLLLGAYQPFRTLNKLVSFRTLFPSHYEKDGFYSPPFLYLPVIQERCLHQGTEWKGNSKEKEWINYRVSSLWILTAKTLEVWATFEKVGGGRGRQI